MVWQILCRNGVRGVTRKPRRVITKADYLALGHALADDMKEYDRIEAEAKAAHEKRRAKVNAAFYAPFGDIK